jgi:alcohol dehydrogenase (cytochrome c)
MKFIRTFFFITLCAAPLFAQGSLDPAKVGQPPTDSWTSYHGDYSGRRYSTLNKINTSNINALSLAWVFRANVNQGAIKASPLVVNGVMYFTAPDHVWAIDARSGREIWHHVWKSQGGIHIGNRGVGILGDTLYVETADCNLVALDLKDGKERWRKTICDLGSLGIAVGYPNILGSVNQNHPKEHSHVYSD